MCPEPHGAFYAYPNVKGLLDRDRWTSCDEHRRAGRLLLKEAEIAVVPGEAFGTPGYFRFSYALSDEDLVEGLGRLAKLAG